MSTQPVWRRGSGRGSGLSSRLNIRPGDGQDRDRFWRAGGKREDIWSSGSRGDKIQLRQPRLCRSIQQGIHCRFGDSCHFSHDLSTCDTQSNRRLANTPEREQAREDYNLWKRLIKKPPSTNDTKAIEKAIEQLWTGALTILDGDDQNLKQMLPRDLESEENYGREHIQTLLSMEASGRACSTFVTLARPFVSVITHPAILDCLSVDAVVGNLYNFISGSNGTRAVPFFQRLCENLINAYRRSTVSKTSTEATVIAIGNALYELLKREQRAAFNEDLPSLIDSLQNAMEAIGMDETPMAFEAVTARNSELRAMVARSNGLLADVEVPKADGILTIPVTSTYPRPVVIPGGHHDNDHVDITKIRILPTEEEIRSDHPEYLPTPDPSQPHFLNNPVARHLDALFRLLRHDIFGELKEVLGRLASTVRGDPTTLATSKLNLGGMRAYMYQNAHVKHITFNQRRGIEIQVSFDQLPSLRKKSVSDRTKFWKDSKRLEEGALLCFVSLIGNRTAFLFLTVSEKRVASKAPYSLDSDGSISTVVTRLATRRHEDLEFLLQLSHQRTRGALIEFPGVILATFVPILENLQNMQRLGRLPFRQWILPDRLATTAEPACIPPPFYARDKDFTYSLDPILKTKGDRLSFSPRVSADDASMIDKLEARTTLDRGQCQALMAALTREFAFIQGPPGTGKSYLGVQLMRVILASKETASLGPVIVVCYTNHALDQFLEHLVETGIERVIRIGSQSKSEALKGKNLRIVSQGERKTKSEGYELATMYQELEQKEDYITGILDSLHAVQKKPNWMNLKDHLERRYPRIHSQFSRFDEDGFEMVGKDPFDDWINETTQEPFPSSGTAGQATSSALGILCAATQDVHCLSVRERRRLLEFWVREIYEDKSDHLFEAVKGAQSLHESMDRIHDEVHRRVLSTADVIGVTTTGLAKRISVLQRVHCKVIICEEGGEVMEPHMVSALLPSVEHFIQIGDHQQLRPQINKYELSLESKQGISYQLDRSQFERLLVTEPGTPSLPVAQLNVQRRMRPEISELIRTTIYPRLIDHPSTKNLPDVVGMRKNVFWLDHENMEAAPDSDRHQKSRSNDWEVDMTHALVRHIVRQGVYSSNDIAVLTPYTGQLQKLRAKMRNEFEIVLSDRDEETLAKDGFNDEAASSENGQSSTENKRKPLEKKKLSEFLRIATVDNFQGEESKITIISLVRSNKDNRVGFLRTTNRINVLLSRAQHGMYLIGNVDTYSNIPMWQTSIGMLRATESIGTAFGLCCPRHPDTVLQASEPLDFEKFSPEGGCQLPCDRRLTSCGHKCLARCHSDRMHEVFKCPQPCQRLHYPCNHGCQKPTCGEDCGRCMVKLDGVLLPCNHLKKAVSCYQTQNLSSIKCNTPVQKQVPGCNHLVEVSCSLDVASLVFRCPTECRTILDCGHRCPGTCGRCNTKDPDVDPTIVHQKCTVICGRRFGTCNHTCTRKCHDGTDCGPCFSPCEVRCSHSACTSRCHQSCAPCIERCAWYCEHRGDYEMPCAAPCSRLPCNKRCFKILSCGHQCPGICGETCAEGYCQQCSDKLDARVDFLEMKSYGEIDLDEEPIVVLGCGHFFTTESLDGLMGMTEVYEVDEHGEFTGLKDVSGSLAEAVPCCPDCKCPVRQFATQRYNRVVNRAVIDEMSKRFLSTGRDNLRELEQQITNLEQSFDKSRDEIIQTIRQAYQGLNLPQANSTKIAKVLKERHAEYTKLERAIKYFCDNVADKHQPAQKLHEATVYATRKAVAASEALDVLLANTSIVDTVPALARDHQITRGGRMIQIKAEYFMINDKFLVFQALKSVSAQKPMKLPGGAPDLLAIPFFKRSESFIDECNSENLPRLAVEVILLYASIARSFESFCRSTKTGLGKAATHTEMAKQLLESAQEVCEKPFQNAKSLRTAVEESIRLMKKEWYEEVTPEEIRAIKAAMVSGSGGIATHSGHWYNCVNGHPFAIGECGMPMQLARCPECGASVGGQNHRAVEGVTRAIGMED